MKKITLIIVFSLLLSACSYIQVKKMDVEQGNVITSNTIHTLKLGMNEKEVTDRVGNPILMNTFNPDQKEYVYYYKPGNEDRGELNRITLIFRHGQLYQMRKYPSSTVL